MVHDMVLIIITPCMVLMIITPWYGPWYGIDIIIIPWYGIDYYYSMMWYIDEYYSTNLEARTRLYS